MSDTLAYSYDAGEHCEYCAIQRFGTEESGRWVPEDAEDSYGNPVGHIAKWDSWWQGNGECETLACHTCEGVIDTVHEDIHTENCEQYDETICQECGDDLYHNVGDFERCRNEYCDYEGYEIRQLDGQLSLTG